MIALALPFFFVFLFIYVFVFVFLFVFVYVFLFVFVSEGATLPERQFVLRDDCTRATICFLVHPDQGETLRVCGFGGGLSGIMV